MSAISEILPKQFAVDRPEPYHYKDTGLLMATLICARSVEVRATDLEEQANIGEDLERFYHGVYGQQAEPFKLLAQPDVAPSLNYKHEIDELSDYAAQYESEGLIIIPDAILAPRPMLVAKPLLRYLSGSILNDSNAPSIAVIGLHEPQRMTASNEAQPSVRFNSEKAFLKGLRGEAKVVGDSLEVSSIRKNANLTSEFDGSLNMNMVTARAMHGCAFTTAGV